MENIYSRHNTEKTLKRLFMIFAFSSLLPAINAGTFTNLPSGVIGFYTRLYDYAGQLEKNYGIILHIYYDRSKVNYNLRARAEAYLANLKPKSADKIILIWVDSARNKGVILCTDAVKTIIPGGDIEILQNDMMNSLIGKWYIGDRTVLTKIAGTMCYIADMRSGQEKTNVWKEDFVPLDDALYRISLNQPFYAITKLFYAEPISFVFYFPMVMYFILVRLIGMPFGQKGFAVSNCAWLVFVIFSAILILQRANMFFPEYVTGFKMFAGLTLPVYIFLYFVFKDSIDTAVYDYWCHITGGGFGGSNAFEGKAW
jgi:hypothetical protein